MNIKFIKILQKHSFTADHFLHKYDCDFNNIEYQKLYEQCVDYVTNDNKLIVIGGENKICDTTVFAINNVFKNQFKLLWFSDEQAENILSLIGDLRQDFITNNNSVIEPDQLILFGLNNKHDTMFYEDRGITCFTATKIKTLSDTLIHEALNVIIEDQPVYIVIDCHVFSENRLDVNRLTRIIKNINTSIIGMSIIGLDSFCDTLNSFNLVRDKIRELWSSIFNMKEKSMNIFTEDSYFLIYRPLDQNDPGIDVGWYILRGLPLDERNKIIESLPNDGMITIDIENEDYLVAKTTMNEQNCKSFYHATSVQDLCLYPDEKKYMCFELINAVNK